MRVPITLSLARTWHHQNLIFADLEGVIVALRGCDMFLIDD